MVVAYLILKTTNNGSLDPRLDISTITRTEYRPPVGQTNVIMLLWKDEQIITVCYWWTLVQRTIITCSSDVRGIKVRNRLLEASHGSLRQYRE